MDSQLAGLLRELEEGNRRDGGTPGTAREAGQFLNILVKAVRATNLLQVGAQDGYLTLWLTDAVATTGGIVTAVEEDVWQFDAATANVDRSPLLGRAHLMQGELQEILPVLEGPFDFILLDGQHGNTLQYLHMLFEQISSNGLICCGRAMSHAGMLAEYLGYVHDCPGMESTLVPVGEGIEVTYKVP